MRLRSIPLGVSEAATKLIVSNLINKIQKNIDLLFNISMPKKASNYLRKTIDDLLRDFLQEKL